MRRDRRLDPPNRTRWRGVLLAAGCLTATLIATDRAAAQPPSTGFPELAVGEWFGNGRAAGISTTDQGGLAIAVDGDFAADLEFAVDIDGSLSGTWVLEGSSVAAFSTQGFEFVDEMTHSAGGDMTGNSQRFSLGTAQVSTNHSVVGDVTYQGSSSDPIGPLDLEVEQIYCNDAWGSWIMSWNLELQDQGYTPSFDGDWYAIRQSSEFSEREGVLLEQLSDLVAEFNADVRDLFQSQPFDEQRGLIVPADTLWQFLYRAIDIQNALRNLTPCDRALVGEVQVEQWIYGFTRRINAIIFNLLNLYDLDADDLRELVSLAAASGAMGEGALDGGADDGDSDGDGEALERALRDAVSAIADDPDASEADRRLATITRWQHGWSAR